MLFAWPQLQTFEVGCGMAYCVSPVLEIDFSIPSSSILLRLGRESNSDICRLVMPKQERQENPLIGL
jgi:hypothetical protein